MQIRYNVEAPRLRRKRKTPNNDHCAVDIFNNRQTMRCKETRPRSTSGGGISAPTTVQAIELARTQLPPKHLAAFMAATQGVMIDMVVMHTRQKIMKIAKRQKWDLVSKTNVDVIVAMADLVVDEWLHPMRYWRHNGEPYISSFSRKMHCDRKTWHKRWQPYFEQVQGLPARWYKEGNYLMQSA